MIASKITSLLNKFPAITRLCIAFSGGLDSTVLLHALAKNMPSKSVTKIMAIHINHHLSAHADDWAAHCKSFALNLGINYVEQAIDLSKIQGNIEAIAREKRYDAFKTCMDENTALLTGHHQDDQAETVLLQLMRGSGVAGLAAMPEVKTFATGYLLRPFLDLNRTMLQMYAVEHQLTWIEDESNQQLCFDRNYIRHQVLPPLQSRWTHASKLIARTAQHAAQAQTLATEVAQQDLIKIIDKFNRINIIQLQSYSEARQINVIRFWLQQVAQLNLEEKQLNEVFHTVINSREDAMPCFRIASWEVRRYQQQLYLCQSKQEKIDTNWSDDWNVKKDYRLPFNLGILIAEEYQPFIKNAQPLRICFRQLGQKVLLKNSMQHYKLKKLMQAWFIPPWERDFVPLVFCGERLISAGIYYFEGVN